MPEHVRLHPAPEHVFAHDVLPEQAHAPPCAQVSVAEPEEERSELEEQATTNETIATRTADFFMKPPMCPSSYHEVGEHERASSAVAQPSTMRRAASRLPAPIADATLRRR